MTSPAPIPGNWITRVFNQPGTYTFQCGQTWNSNAFKIECIGGGQGGTTPSGSQKIGGFGGAAGWYAYTDNTGQIPTPGYIPQKGDVITIVVADRAPPVPYIYNTNIPNVWDAGNPSYCSVGVALVCLAPGGQWIGDNANEGSPVHQTFFATGAVAGSGTNLDDDGNGFLNVDGANFTFLETGPGSGGGALGQIVTAFSTYTITGGFGGVPVISGINPSAYLGGGGGVPYWPPPNEPAVPAIQTRHSAGGVLAANIGGATLTLGGLYGPNGTNSNGVNGLNGTPIWVDSVDPNITFSLGCGGSAGGGGWSFTQPFPPLGLDIAAATKAQIIAYAGTGGSVIAGQSIGQIAGDGGNAAGGGGGSIGLGLLNDEQGSGGFGGQGAVIISWLPDIPNNQQAALIPLPDPRYAVNRRLLFLPWWVK